MSVFVKKSTDAGAPVVTGAVGGAIALFDFLLVTTLGWTKAFVNAANSVAAYKQPAGTNGFYLRVDASNASYLRLVGYEAMTAIDVGTGAFPTAAQASGGLYQSTEAAATAVQWRFYSNGKIFYLFITAGSYWQPIVFGDINSYKASDAFGTVLIAANSTGNTYNTFSMMMSSLSSVPAAHYLARTAAQTGVAVACGKLSDYTRSNNSAHIGQGGVAYPSPIEGGLLMAPVWVAEANLGARGLLPGVWNPLHNQPLANGDTFTGVGGLNGRTFDVQSCLTTSGNYAQVFMETSDTWGEP